MPAVAPSMTEGNIVRWAKKEGDPVKQGEVLLEIETDKAVVEVEAQQDGVLGSILVPEGTSGVKVATVIALLAGKGEKAPAAAAPKQPARAAVQPPAAAAPAHAVARDPGGRVFASPLARRIARDLNVDLARVSGSGPNGRVLKADVQAASRAGATALAARPAGPAYEDIPHSNTRRVIAQRLAEAKRSVPHFYLTIDCEVDALLAARTQANEMVAGLKLSVNDLVIKAAALALRKVPAVNAAWGENAIRRFRDVDVAVAVSAPSGLVTPVVRNADAKSLREISAEMKELAARAQQSRLRPDEYQGGGFTVSNLGMVGIREFAAIINPPQACILAVGASEQRPIVRDGALAVATLMTCTLSVDHRAVDGTLGAAFLAAFKKLVESPIALFL
ncbi:MAG: pyruvate dehydrogenase complex dihydrolipoamide acetyltransferase [Betaproteobacteria bacterium RBG_16_64_18]|nr:MAG: pyruvate dehydrogenase complex dihydrolipoamide acetyltransferase [Betaproteobacteria bacterium RBG_16_64_18]OGA39230.1 MAG: pyruvate dehydrogenase complex dihydrolipoamide acetyltransferase [Betaproteobacteria bacterium RIFCSPLOWO2_12_FULL_65_110]